MGNFRNLEQFREFKRHDFEAIDSQVKIFTNIISQYESRPQNIGHKPVCLQSQAALKVARFQLLHPQQLPHDKIFCGQESSHKVEAQVELRNCSQHTALLNASIKCLSC